MLSYKTLALDGKAALKALSEGTGQLIGYASVFGGVDAYGDTIQRGAYAETIPQFIHRGTLHAEHESHIRLGTITDAKEDDHGLLIVSDFHSDPEAQRYRAQILERLERGKFVGLSIGYLAQDFDLRDAAPDEESQRYDGKIRILKKIKLYEVSEVTVPADESAEVIAAKSRTFHDHSDAVRIALAEWVERAKSGSDIRAKDGRGLSQARRDQMAAMSGSLRSAADEVDALLVPPPAPVYRPSVELERRRHRLERLGILERPA